MSLSRPLSGTAGCETSGGYQKFIASPLPLSNESVAKGQVRGLLRRLNTKPAVLHIQSLPKKRGPAYRKVTRIFRGHFADRMVFDAESGEGKDRIFTLLYLAPHAKRERLAVFAVVVSFRDPHAAVTIRVPMEISFHAIQRLVQRLRTNDWNSIAAEIGLCVIPMGLEPELGTRRIETPHGHFVCITDEHVTTVVTFINN